jgi:hypothetical protein
VLLAAAGESAGATQPPIITAARRRPQPRRVFAGFDTTVPLIWKKVVTALQ